MFSFSRVGKVEAGGVKSIHSDQIAEPDGGNESTLDPPPPTPEPPEGHPVCRMAPSTELDAQGTQLV